MRSRILDKKILLGLGVLCLLIFGIFSLGQTKEKKSEFKIEKWPQIDEPVVDIIYDYTEMTVKEAKALGVKGLEKKKLGEKIKVKYPKVAIGKFTEKPRWLPYAKSLKFFNKKGNLVKEFPLQKGIAGVSHPSIITISKNKKFICVNNIAIPTEEAESIVLNTEGKILWKVKHILSDVYPSPNGEYIVGSTFWGGDPIEVYSKNRLIKRIENAHSWDVDFSEDGNFFAISFAISVGGQGKGKILTLFDKEGNEIWRRENIISDGGQQCLVSFSDDNKIDVVSGIGIKDEWKFFSFDRNGNLIRTQENAKEKFAEVLYKKHRRKVYGISEEFYKKLDKKLEDE